MKQIEDLNSNENENNRNLKIPTHYKNCPLRPWRIETDIAHTKKTKF